MMKNLSGFQKLQVRDMIKTACELDNPKLIHFLMDQYPDVDPSFEYVIEYSCDDNMEVMKYCLNELKIDPSHHKNVWLRRAALNGNLEFVKMLVKDERVNVSACNNEALIEALQYKHYDVAKELVKHLKKPLRREDIDFPLPEDISEMIENHFENDEKETQQKKIKK